MISPQADQASFQPGQGYRLHGLLLEQFLRDIQQDFLIFQAVDDKIRLDRALGDACHAANNF